MRHPRRLSNSAFDRIEASPFTRGDRHRPDPAPSERRTANRITVLLSAPLFGEAITRIHRGESVGALFSSEVQLVEEMTFWGSHDADDQDEPPTPMPVAR